MNKKIPCPETNGPETNGPETNDPETSDPEAGYPKAGHPKAVPQSRDFHLVELSEDHAKKILGWKYEAPYDFYNPPLERTSDEDYIKEFLNPELRFHAVLDEDQRFIGFCSFGLDGQVPGGDYEVSALDIGVGMEPQFTGKGLGTVFFRSILEHARLSMNPPSVRVTVADFNKRALRLYRKFGFIEQSCFRDLARPVSYVILLKEIKSRGD